MGLVNEVVAAEELIPAARKLAATLIASSPTSLERTKRLLLQMSQSGTRSRYLSRHSRKFRYSLYARFHGRPLRVLGKAHAEMEWQLSGRLRTARALKRGTSRRLFSAALKRSFARINARAPTGVTLLPTLCYNPLPMSRDNSAHHSDGHDRFYDTTVRVRYAETDQMGVVYYSNYYLWFEVGRVELCRQLGFEYKKMESEDDSFIVVAESSLPLSQARRNSMTSCASARASPSPTPHHPLRL